MVGRAGWDTSRGQSAAAAAAARSAPLVRPTERTWQPTFTTKPVFRTSGRFGLFRSSPSSQRDIKSRKFQTRQPGASARCVGLKCAPGVRARGGEGRMDGGRVESESGKVLSDSGDSNAVPTLRAAPI